MLEKWRRNEYVLLSCINCFTTVGCKERREDSVAKSLEVLTSGLREHGADVLGEGGNGTDVGVLMGRRVQEVQVREGVGDLLGVVDEDLVTAVDHRDGRLRASIYGGAQGK